MKKILLLVIFIFGISSEISSQEYMTSLDVAKSLGLVQNKLLFVIWEDAYYAPYPVLIKDESGNAVVDDLFSNETLNEIIWKHFVPVILSESKYAELFEAVKGKRSQTYIDRFNDDSIKIMDVNGNIINTTPIYYDYLDIIRFISNYALDTSYLQTELQNYRAQKDFNTIYRLAKRYIDFGALVKDDIREEIIKLSTLYIDEAETFISEETETMQPELQQKLELLRLKQFLILDNPRKVLRKLKRMEANNIVDSNKELWNFLHYTAYLLDRDESKARIWRSKVSLVNLKKANMIVNSNAD